jgi:hypothetical protein
MMLTISVQDLLHLPWQPAWKTGFRIYVVREGDIVFYVGQSHDPVDRLLQHLSHPEASFQQLPSALGQLILDNRPGSLAWEIDLMTMADCRPFVARRCPAWLWPVELSAETQPTGAQSREAALVARAWEDRYVGWAEQAMIDHLRPALNVSGNRGPGRCRVPEKYLRPGCANDGVILD